MEIDLGPFREYVQDLKKLQKNIAQMSGEQLNRITDRHLARVKENTAVGSSPDSPTLRNTWDRSGVVRTADGVSAEVFNPTEYAAYYEFGHRQTPGRVVFIPLRPGDSKYGIPAHQAKNGPHAGEWGIWLRLKKSYVKGAFVMTDSEQKAQRELDAAVKKIMAAVQKEMDG